MFKKACLAVSAIFLSVFLLSGVALAVETPPYDIYGILS